MVSFLLRKFFKAVEESPFLVVEVCDVDFDFDSVRHKGHPRAWLIIDVT